MHFDLESFQVACAVHPSTYLNKILLGSRQGQLQLWNIRTNKLIYAFTGWGSPVLVLSQSPAVDVVGVGLESGAIVVHNLRYDETIMKFHQDWGPVTAISFRSGSLILFCVYLRKSVVSFFSLPPSHPPTFPPSYPPSHPSSPPPPSPPPPFHPPPFHPPILPPLPLILPPTLLLLPPSLPSHPPSPPRWYQHSGFSQPPWTHCRLGP